MGYLKQKIQTIIACPLSRVGFIRVMGWANADRQSSPLPSNIVAAKSAVQNKSTTTQAVVNEINVMRKSLDSEASSPPRLGELPLIVLTSGKRLFKGRPGNKEIRRIGIRLQNELASLSTNSVHIVAKNSGHYVMYDQPDLVIDSILTILEKAKGTQPINRVEPD